MRTSFPLSLVALLVSSCMAPDREQTASAGPSSQGGSGGESGTCDPPVPGAGTCNPYSPRCGCEEADTVCDFLDDTGRVGCVVTQHIPRGGRCALSGACDTGLTCNLGICTSLCKNAYECPVVGADCGPMHNSFGDVVPGLTTCSDDCNLTQPSPDCGSDPEVGCFPLGTQGEPPGHSLCVKMGTGTGYCSKTSDCKPGYFCVLGSGGGCKKWCRIGVSGDCTGSSCGHIPGGDFYVQNVAYGFCGI